MDDPDILYLTTGEKELQDVLLQLAGKVNSYIDNANTDDSRYVGNKHVSHTASIQNDTASKHTYTAPVLLHNIY